MSYFPMYALFDGPIEWPLLEERLTAELAPCLPKVEIISEQATGRQWPALHMYSEHDDVVVRQKECGIVSVDFWDFDSDIYDQGGPNQEMANHKRDTALALVRTLIRECGARLAYMSSASDKLASEVGHHEIVRGIMAGLDSPESLATHLRQPCYFWIMAMAKEDTALQKQVALAQPHWVVIDDGPGIILMEDRQEQPMFMDVEE